MFKHILVPIDGSDCAFHALELAAAFAREQQARLTVCTVVDPAKAASMAFGEATMAAACFDALDEEGKGLVKDAADRIRTFWAADTAVLDGAPVEGIVEFAREHDADLIMMGSHGRSGLPRFFLGSVAEGVVRSATAPVMIVRHVPQTTKAPKQAPQTASEAPAGA